MIYDVIILGLGGMGAAIADSLAGRGLNVLGLERFEPVHDKGSSHGESRVIRKAYFEDPRYVPLLLRAYDLWADLENTQAEKLLVKSGCVMMGPPTSAVLEGARRSAEQFNLSYEMLTRDQLKQRYGFTTPENTIGFFEPDGGYLRVEKCVDAFHTRARARGADLRFNAEVLKWNDHSVTTANETFQTKRVVIATGAWAAGRVNEPLKPKRAIQFWFEAISSEDLPVFFQDTPGGRWIYGFPQLGDTLKVAFHDALEDADPDTINRNVSQDEVETISAPARALLSKLGNFRKAKTCLYTMTPDENFIIGEKNGVILATGFSGHGFKFAPVVGEIVSDLVQGLPRDDIGLFTPDRFGTKP